MKITQEQQTWLDNRSAMSSRELSVLTRGITTGKSSVNDFFNRYDEWVLEQSGVEHEGAKVLFLGLEVAPSITLAFSYFKHFSKADHILQSPYILTAAWNWLHDTERKVYKTALPHYVGTWEQDATDDSQLTADLWDLLDQADIIVAHNAPFDVGWMNQQFAKHDMPEPSPYRVVCTCKGLKKHFSLPSNSLDHSTLYFELERKRSHTGIDLWERCMEGDVAAFEEMLEYNVGDIPTLRQLYLKTRRFITNHPNVALYFGHNDSTMRCNICGSSELEQLTGKFATTSLSAFASYRCGNCGHVSRSGQALNTKENRKTLLRNVLK